MRNLGTRAFIRYTLTPLRRCPKRAITKIPQSIEITPTTSKYSYPSGRWTMTMSRQVRSCTKNRNRTKVATRSGGIPTSTWAKELCAMTIPTPNLIYFKRYLKAVRGTLARHSRKFRNTYSIREGWLISSHHFSGKKTIWWTVEIQDSMKREPKLPAYRIPSTVKRNFWIISTSRTYLLGSLNSVKIGLFHLPLQISHL